MSEYMVKVKITAAGSYKVPINKRVLGVYSTSNITLGWDYNGEIGTITSVGAIAWEPRVPFEPSSTSKLVITAAAPADVTIRME